MTGTPSDKAIPAVGSKRGTRRPRVLAVSSGGGHWVQLMRLQNAFEGCDVAYATVLAWNKQDIKDPDARFHVLPDATRWNKFVLLWLFVRVVMLILRERPDVVITTGAAPGFFAIVVGKIFRRKTCWIDSIANVDELSMSGRKAKRWASLWLTQWEHLSTKDGPDYFGNVLASESSKTATSDEDDDSAPPDPESGNGETANDTSKSKEPGTIKGVLDCPIRPRVLAISSGGGHWVELMRLEPAFEGCNVCFASVCEDLRSTVERKGATFYCIPDTTRWSISRIPWSFVVIVRILLKEKPDVIITTGAAPGYLACIAGKLLGIRCGWVDSIANADELSLSGDKAKKWIDLLLTQWPNLARDQGPQYRGNVL
jgi:UDP-N-acetylglucosamine:LPS N-acetylglucosamine transferase